MKKLAMLAILALIMVSCGKTDTEVEIENEENIEFITDEGNEKNPNEEINIDDMYEFSDEESKNEENSSNNSGSKVETETEVKIETKTEVETSDISEEEILKDIDALINEIINSAENG